METPYIKILDRGRAIKEVEDNFHQQIEVMQDVLNFGTNLLIRILGNSKKTIEHIVVVSVLFKHILSMVDSIENQLSKGIIYSTHLQLRSLFEATLFIEWILKQDSEKRANCYYIGYYRKEKVTLENFIKNYEKTPNFSKRINKAKEKFKDAPEDLVQMAQVEIKKINELLNHKIYSEIINDFETMEKKRKRVTTLSWYETTGIHSIHQMAEKLGRLDEYFILYNQLSKIIHSSVMKEQVTVKDKKIEIRPIRELENINTVITNTFTYTFRVYRLLIGKYRPEEMELFTRKYLENWREPYRNIKQIVYNE